MATQTRWTYTADTPAWSGYAGTTTARKPSEKPKADPCCEPCPDCGGLECYCRPRFFAGQLLTEQELNRLQDYVIAKNKLHNRYLVGAGIVCGLEAECNPCGDMVAVSPGYAISPCGEDIVVCKPDSVDVCALIARCRETDEPDCRPYAPGKDDCAEIIEDWVLTIRYAEAPSRAEPIAKAQSCGCGSHKAGGCGCGGKSAASCGCGKGGGCGCSSGPAKAAIATRMSAEPVLRRGAPPACVPQLTCESYRYDVFRMPDPPKRDPERDPEHPFSGLLDGLSGPFVDRLRCCLREIEDAIPPLAAGSTSDAAYRQKAVLWLCDARSGLKRILMRRGGHDCTLIDRLMAIPVPKADDIEAFVEVYGQAVRELLVIIFEMLVECLCSALIPACPDADDPRIPIAVVKVRRDSCEIISVCNWTPLRRQLVTWPAINYWFGWLPQFSVVREFIHLICCELFGLFDDERGTWHKPSAGVLREAMRDAEAAEPATAAAKDDDHLFLARSLDSVIARRAAGLPTPEVPANGFRTSDLMALFAGPPGSAGSAAGKEAAERVLAELSRPLREALPAGGFKPIFGQPAAPSVDLGAEIAALRKTVTEQQNRITILERVAAAQQPAAPRGSGRSARQKK